jgi:NhaA family Na+:H+ antiporter
MLKTPRSANLAAAAMQRFMQPFRRFFETETSGGIVLLFATFIALALANSAWSEKYTAIWQTPAAITVNGFKLELPLLLWVNDALMTLFFFVVGLEIKREIVLGELREWRKAALPVLAAVGGMIAPAVIFLALRAGKEGARGWGIPTATDIAFVVGFLALFGRRVPLGLKIMLLSLAIADDIGAVVLIAVFYSNDVSVFPLLGAAVGFGLVVTLRYLGVNRIGIYVLLGIAIWFAFLQAHVHPTVAGVILGLLTPTVAQYEGTEMLENVDRLLSRMRQSVPHGSEQVKLLHQLESAAWQSVSPQERLEVTLHPWVAFFIVPIFALANAGVEIRPESIRHGVGWAIALGLFLGKPLGIVAASALAIKLKLAKLPTGVNWRIMLGAGCLGGIGFTMSVFIAGLALPDQLLDSAKIGILAGSLLSSVVGTIILAASLPERAPLDKEANGEMP